MTPLERAARALSRLSCPPGGEAQFPCVSAYEWEAKNWRDHIPAVRAVLTAIREPSEGMVVDALDYEARDSRATSRNIWQAMIDAALKEG